MTRYTLTEWLVLVVVALLVALFVIAWNLGAI